MVCCDMCDRWVHTGLNKLHEHLHDFLMTLVLEDLHLTLFLLFRGVVVHLYIACERLFSVGCSIEFGHCMGRKLTPELKNTTLIKYKRSICLVCHP